jgi:hypothetical protein
MNDLNTLNQRLSAAFGGLDTRADFNARLQARLHAESQKDATDLANRARRTEQERYVAARRELLSLRYWKKSFSRLVTRERFGLGPLELAGAAALIIGVLTSVISRDELRQYAPTAITILGILLALSPVISTAALKRN